MFEVFVLIAKHQPEILLPMVIILLAALIVAIRRVGQK